MYWSRMPALRTWLIILVMNQLVLVCMDAQFDVVVLGKLYAACTSLYRPCVWWWWCGGLFISLYLRMQSLETLKADSIVKTLSYLGTLRAKAIHQSWTYPPYANKLIKTLPFCWICVRRKMLREVKACYIIKSRLVNPLVAPKWKDKQIKL